MPHQAPAPVRWGILQRQRLRAVREGNQQTEKECVQILRYEFGVRTASQPNLSRWESGRIQRPGCASQLVTYCDTYGGAMVLSVTGEDSGEDRATIGLRKADSEGLTPEDNEFRRLVGRIADQPLLGPSQEELIAGIIRRLERGPPLSLEDRATFLDLLRILRIGVFSENP